MQIIEWNNTTLRPKPLFQQQQQGNYNSTTAVTYLYQSSTTQQAD